MEASLGKLLRFDRPKRATDSRGPLPGDAQIIFFTGVRYERGTPPPPKTGLEPGRRKRKRG